MALPTISHEFRIVADPELRFAPSGVAVCKIRMVASRRKQVDGEWQDTNTFWITGTAFKELAENIAENFSKGDLAVVSGQIETQEWEQDGQKRSAPALLIEAIGKSLRFAGQSRGQGAQNRGQGAPAAAQQGQAPQGGYSQPQGGYAQPQQQGYAPSGGGSEMNQGGFPAEPPW